MNSLLNICFSDLSRDARVRRQLLTLKEYYNVTALGLKHPGINGVGFLETHLKSKNIIKKIFSVFLLLGGFYEKYYWMSAHIRQSYHNLKKSKFDIIYANDIESLPLAVKISRGTKLIFDAHEYAPLEFDDSLLWRILFKNYRKYLCSKYIPCANKMITVCEGIAQEYFKEYNVLPSVINNAPFYHAIKPHQNHNKMIKMVHHGGASRSRKIEKMIKLMDYIDERYLLDLILIPVDHKYIDKLKKMARPNSRIRILKPISHSDVINTINRYDIGLYILEPNNFNNRYSLPNKFFDFIQARLAIAIGPSTEMANIVQKYDCGIISEDFEPKTMASKLNSLKFEKLQYHKLRAHVAAEDLCFEKNSSILLNLLN